MATNYFGFQIVLRNELRLLWLSWRGPLLLLFVTLVLSAYVTLLALDPENNVLTQRVIINFVLQIATLSGIGVVLLLGANSFSGERDQRTLEGLLLTPMPRGQIALGKLMAMYTLWLAIIPTAIPYIWLVTRGTTLLVESILLLIVVGSILVLLCALIATFVSGLAATNLVSFVIGTLIIALLAAPTQLPGSVKSLPAVATFLRINPITAATQFQGQILVDGDLWTDIAGQLTSPIIATILLAVLFPILLNRLMTLSGGMQR